MSDFEVQYMRALGCSSVFSFDKGETDWCKRVHVHRPPYPWKVLVVTCWWILKSWWLPFCRLFYLCHFSSKIYIPSVFIFEVSNSYERVLVCLGIFPLSRCKLDICIYSDTHPLSQCAIIKILHILSSLWTPLARPFSISSWWYNSLSCLMATISAFGKNVSR